MSEKIEFTNPDILSGYGHESQKKTLIEFAKTLPHIPKFRDYEDNKWIKRYNDVVTEYLQEKINIQALEATLDLQLNFSTYSRPCMWEWGVRLIYSRNAIEIYITLPGACKEKKEVFFRGMNESLKNWASYYQKLIPLRVYMENYESREDYEDSDDFEQWMAVSSNVFLSEKL